MEHYIINVTDITYLSELTPPTFICIHSMKSGRGLIRRRFAITYVATH
jgi:hypothetical protein